MPLTSPQTDACWKAVVAADLAAANLAKADLKAAVTAIDTWCETNSTSFNAAIPQPTRSALSAQGKSVLLAYVAMKRTGIL